MIAGARALIGRDHRIAGEFFPSLIFNEVVAGGGRVALRPVDFFIHWGVPEQLEDFNRWGRVVKARPPAQGDGLPVNIMCMAGLGTRVKALSDQPKALIPVEGKPMYAYVADWFPASAITLITLASIADELRAGGFQGDTLLLPRQTASQFETLVSAAPLLQECNDFFLTSCDAYGLFDYARFREAVARNRPAAVIFTFRPSLAQAKLTGRHTHVSVDGERITAVHIKSKSGPDDAGLAGFFWVAEGAVFGMLGEIPEWTEGEMIADTIFKHFVDVGLTVMAYPLDEYVHLGTSEELQEHRYWFDRRHLFEAS
jgi:NDP-sugar pyrophosphorylase family protein